MKTQNIQSGDDVRITGSKYNHLPDGRFHVVSVHDWHCVVRSYKDQRSYPVDTPFLSKID